MFVVSVKSDKAIKIAVCFLLVCALSIGGIIYVAKENALPASNMGGISMRAETHEERIAFFSQFIYHYWYGVHSSIVNVVH